MQSFRDIPWFRIFAEGLAIVASILLAFSIDTWWSNRQVLRDVQENLVALRGELHENIREIKHELTFKKAVVDSIEKLFLSIDSTNTVSQGEIDKLISDLTWDGRIDVSTGALLNVLQSSVFTGIEDAELQRALAILPDIYENTALVELTVADFTNQQVIAYINENGSLNQIYNSGGRFGRPGTGDFGSDFRFPTTTEHDHTNLLASDEFLGLLAIAHDLHSDVIIYYQRLEPRIDRTIELIEHQIL